MKLLCFLAIITSLGCAAGDKRPNAGYAGGVIRGVGRPGQVGNGTHNGRGYPSDRKERKASENRQDRKSPPGGDARNSTIST